jgi:hypothetical protein
VIFACGTKLMRIFSPYSPSSAGVRSVGALVVVVLGGWCVWVVGGGCSTPRSLCSLGVVLGWLVGVVEPFFCWGSLSRGVGCGCLRQLAYHCRVAIVGGV